MHILPYDICLRLRDVGLPQPEPCEGQLWYLPFMGTVNGIYLPYLINYLSIEQLMVYFSGVGIPVQYKTHIGAGLAPKAFEETTKIFCPDAEYLAQHLNFISPPENPTDPPEKGILNFFVRNYLHRHEKKPAP